MPSLRHANESTLCPHPTNRKTLFENLLRIHYTALVNKVLYFLHQCDTFLALRVM